MNLFFIVMILNQNSYRENGNELIHHHQLNSNNLAVLHSFFWDHKGIIRKEPTPVGVTIIKTYYPDILVNKLHPKIKKQR